MDTRDDRTTARSGAEEKEERTAPLEKGRGRNASAKTKAPDRGETTHRIPERKEEGGVGERGTEESGPAKPPAGEKKARDPGG